MSENIIESKQYIKHINECCAKINECCKKIAEQDGFKLPKIGGYIKKDNGLWDFIEGKGEYKKINGDLQWCLK